MMVPGPRGNSFIERNTYRSTCDNRANLGLLFAIILVFACGDQSGVAGGVETVRSDSAGVEIVVNVVDAEDVPVFATIDTTNMLRIGVVDGRPEEVFGTVDDVLPLGNGGVAVLDRQTAVVRVFDPNGEHTYSLGNKGQGPGEFEQPVRLGLVPGDTIAVYDTRLRRITHFDPTGALGRVTTLKDTQGQVTVAAFLSDGRLIGQSHWRSPNSAATPGPEPTLVRDTVVLTLFGVDGVALDTLDKVYGQESLVSIQRLERAFAVRKRAPAFARNNLFAAHPEGVWSFPNDRFELRLRATASGKLIRIVRVPGLDRPVTDGIAQAIRDRAFEEATTPADRRATALWYDLSPRLEVMPAFDRIVVDDEARLWLRQWSGLDEAIRWWVVSGKGQLLGSVDLPRGTVIRAVRCGKLWGVEQDELDVSYVVRYAINTDRSC